MIKYFIEDREGRWLADPEQRGEGWTRDPFKAWAFDYERTVMANCERVCSTSNFLNFIAKERCLSDDVHVTEQEFIELPKESGCGPVAHLSSTLHKQLMDHLVTGESVVATTYGMLRDYSPENYGGYKGPDE